MLTCRICWGSKVDQTTGPLLSPCACRGSSAHAHLGCLKQWAVCESNANSTIGGSGTAFEMCPVCKQDYDGDAGIELLRENLRCEEQRAVGTSSVNEQSSRADPRKKPLGARAGLCKQHAGQ